jgi:predicted MFS family arabinose efflux permease
MSQERSDGPSARFYVGYALWLLFCVNALSYFDRSLLSLVLEDVKLEFGLSDTAAGFLSGFAISLFYGLLGIPMAWAADRWNRVRIMAWAITVWSLATSLTGAAGNFVQLVFARVMVGAGEAGGAPPVHSMTADLVPPARRSSALAFVTMGSSIGIALGAGYAGFMNDLAGWRMVFLLAGVPGVLLAVLIWLTLRDPARGASDPGGVAAVEPPYVLSDGLRRLAKTPGYMHIVLAISLTFLVSYGFSAWYPAFFVRTHELSTTTLGLWMMLAGGAAQLLGLYLGGVLGNRLFARSSDLRWALWVPMICMAAAQPFKIWALLVPDPWLALFLLLVPSVLNLVYVGPVFALMQQLVGVRLRSLATAVIMLCGSLIGTGLGPLATGLISDALQPAFNAESLRWSLIAMTAVYVWAIAHFWLAGRRLAPTPDAAAPAQ